MDLNIFSPQQTQRQSFIAIKSSSRACIDLVFVLHYKILNCSEITPKTGTGDGAVRQARAA